MNGDWIEFGTCPVCGFRMLPLLDDLPCGHEEPPIVDHLTISGVVYSWTRTAFGDKPVRFAAVDFFDGALRVTAPLLQDTDPAIGDRVTLTRGRDTPYAFVPNT